MMALLAICSGNSPVTGEFPEQRPVTRSFGVFFDLRLNERLSKQSWGWWFETPSHPFWRHSNGKQITTIVCDSMNAMASQITSLTIVYSIVYSVADQGKHQSSASLAFVTGIHRWPVNSPHKWPGTRKMFPVDDVIMWVPVLMVMLYKTKIICIIVPAQLTLVHVCLWYFGNYKKRDSLK